MAPLLFTVFFGMIEMGRAVMVHQVLVNAAREGARTAAMNSATASEVKAQVEAALAQASVTGATATITPNPIVPGSPVTVAVEVPFNSVSWLPKSRYLEGITLDTAVVMQTEFPIESP